MIIKPDKKSREVACNVSTILQKVALKTPAARKLSLADGKKLAYKFIDKWHSEK